LRMTTEKLRNPDERGISDAMVLKFE